jgi:sugar (pentulose or hexulose) kinase
VRRAAAGGGGARSQVWLQLTAEVCDLPITVPRYAEAAGSMVSEERRIEPRGISARFEHGYQTYLRLYEATRPLL